MSNQEIFYIKIADLIVEMHAGSIFANEHCKDYLALPTDTPDIVATALKEEIELEKRQSEKPLSDGYCEDICLYRSIAEQLPKFDGAVFHGAAVEVDGKGYLFTAPSGTGKTTHIRLWLEHFGDKVEIINGDKPILRLTQSEVTVFSTPWAGKEGMQKNTQAPVGAICLIRQAKENRITRIKPGEYFEALIKQFYLPKDRSALMKTIDIVDTVLKKTPLYLLECDISINAAKLSFEALTGKRLT